MAKQNIGKGGSQLAKSFPDKKKLAKSLLGVQDAEVWFFNV